MNRLAFGLVLTLAAALLGQTTVHLRTQARSGCIVQDASLHCPDGLSAGNGVDTGYFDGLAGPAPSAPDPGHFRLYFRPDGRLAVIDSAGIVRVYVAEGDAVLTSLSARIAALESR